MNAWSEWIRIFPCSSSTLPGAHPKKFYTAVRASKKRNGKAMESLHVKDTWSGIRKSQKRDFYEVHRKAALLVWRRSVGEDSGRDHGLVGQLTNGQEGARPVYVLHQDRHSLVVKDDILDPINVVRHG
jgi:hypothetical protein